MLPKTLKLGSLNVKTLKNDENLLELEEASLNSNICTEDNLGLSETRRLREHIITTRTKKGNVLCYIYVGKEV